MLSIRNNLLIISSLLAFWPIQSFGAIEIYKLSGDFPLQVPPELSNKLGFNQIINDPLNSPGKVGVIKLTLPYPWLDREDLNILNARLNTPWAPEGPNHILVKKYGKPRFGGKIEGADLLAIIKASLTEEAFRSFAKAQLALSAQEFSSLISDIAKEIKIKIIADKIIPIRNLKEFSKLLAEESFDIFIGFHSKNILILVAQPQKDPSSSVALIFNIPDYLIAQITAAS